MIKDEGIFGTLPPTPFYPRKPLTISPLGHPSILQSYLSDISAPQRSASVGIGASDNRGTGPWRVAWFGSLENVGTEKGELTGRSSSAMLQEIRPREDASPSSYKWFVSRSLDFGDGVCVHIFELGNAFPNSFLGCSHSWVVVSPVLFDAQICFRFNLSHEHCLWLR